MSMRKTLSVKLKSAFEKTRSALQAQWDAFLEDGDDSPVSRISELLPYGFEVAPGIFTVHETLSDKVTALGYVIEIAPLAGYVEKTADDLHSLLTMAFPDNTNLQFTIFASPDIRWATSAYRYSRTSPAVLEGRERASAQTLSELARERAAYLTAMTRSACAGHDQFRVRHFRTWLSVTVALASLKGGDYKAKAKEVEKLRQKHTAILTHASVYPRVWNAEDLLSTCRALLNPQNAFAPFEALRETSGAEADKLDELLDARTSRAVNPFEPLSKQIVHPDTRIAIDEAAIHFSAAGNVPAASVSAIALSVAGYPDRYGLWQCLDWLGSADVLIPCPFLVTTLIATGEPQKTREHANLMAARSKQIAMTEMAYFLSYLKERKNDYDIVEAEYAQNGGLARVTHQVLIFPPTDKVQDAEAAVRSVFKAAQLELANDACMQWQGFLSSLPMSVTARTACEIYQAQRATTQTLSSISQMIPVIAEFTGTGSRDGEAGLTPMLLLTGRHGQIAPFDIFAKEASNFNAVIVGESGSGKSALTNDLITGNLATGGKCYVIDVGGSYKKLCHLLDGQWIEYRRDQPLVINPFEFVTNLTEDEGYLIPILLEMTQPNPTWISDATTALKSHVHYLLDQCAPNETLSITRLVESLRTAVKDPKAGPTALGPDQRILDLADSLSHYAEDGIYGAYFNGKSTVNFEADFIVLELEGLKTRKLLQNVILLCLIFMITRELAAGELSRHKMVVIDEAWDLLDHKHAGEFINTGYRRSRKQNASFITITQSFKDYVANDTARAAFTNAHWQFALKQRADALEAAKDITTFSAWEKRTIDSLRMKKDQYAECLLRMGNSGGAILQIRFDDFSRLLYSTRADDVARINALMNRGLTIHEALHAIVHKTKEIDHDS